MTEPAPKDTKSTFDAAVAHFQAGRFAFLQIILPFLLLVFVPFTMLVAQVERIWCALTFMLIAAGIIAYGVVKYRAGWAWGGWMATAGVAAILSCLWYGTFGPCEVSPTRIIKTHRAYVRVAGVFLGRRLAEKYPGAKALVIVDPQLPGYPKPDGTFLESLKAGLGKSVSIVKEVSPPLPKEIQAPNSQTADGKPNPVSMLPIDTWLTPDAFDKMLEPWAGQYDMLITTIGLPLKHQDLRIWTVKPPPRVVLATGVIQKLRHLIESGAIVAAMTFNPQAVSDSRMPPKDLDTAFNKRYLLITPENVAQMAEEYPELFEAGKAEPKAK